MEQDQVTGVEENSTNYSSSKYVRPDGVPADNVIFTITNKGRNPQITQLEILLVKRKKWPYKGCWALPGGFSNPNETLLEAAKRELKEETSLDGLYVEHLNVYDKPKRDPRGWIISSAYCALVNEDCLKNRKAADDAEEVELIPLSKVLSMQTGNEEGENFDKLAFDHITIINDALGMIRTKMLTTNIAKEFLPEQFTLLELYRVITTVVPEFKEVIPELQKGNFKRKVLSRGILKEVQGTSNRASNRSAQLYSFTDEVPIISIYS